jgi:hypothetical protein
VTRVVTSSLVLSLVLVALGGAAALACDDAEAYRARRDALAAKAAQLSKEDVARERFALGLWARDRSLLEEAQAEFRAVLALHPDHEAAHAALGDVRLGDRWIAHDEAMEAKGLVRRDGRWLLREEAEVLDLPAREKALRREQQAKVEQLLRAYASGSDAQRKFALASLGTVEDRWKTEPFAYALRAKSEAVRVLAAKELGRLGSRRALQPLVKRAVLDPSQEVREAAVDAAKQIGDANLLAPLAQALQSKTPEVFTNAAAAIGRLGDVRGVRYLVWRLESHGATGQRVFSNFTNQLTYIQDFDVEVAQTAFIADPIVGVLQEGIVLDVQLHAVDRQLTWVEREVMHGALRRLTGATDVKNEPGAWAAWWKDHAKELGEPVAAK